MLLIVEAESDCAIRDRLAADPWAAMDLLQVDSVEPWEILLSRDCPA